MLIRNFCTINSLLAPLWFLFAMKRNQNYAGARLHMPTDIPVKIHRCTYNTFTDMRGTRNSPSDPYLTPMCNEVEPKYTGA